MELNLDKNEIIICNIESMIGEQSFESDILLPDYYENIMKILKCNVTPVILKTNILGNKITVDGIAIIKIYYQTIENKVKTISSKVNFSKNFDLKDQINNAHVDSKISLDYVNCRAVDERKIDVKGALSIKIKIFCNNKENILLNASGVGLQIKKDNIKNMVITGNSNQFVIKEDLELENTKPDIGNIIRYDINTNITEKKVIENKIICKGEVLLKILYNPFKDENEEVVPVSVEFVLPIHNIIDFSGVEERSNCEVSFNDILTEIIPKSDDNGKNRYFSVEIDFNINSKCNKEIESKVIVDAYSTLMDVKCLNKTLNCCKILNQINEGISVEANVTVPYTDNFKILDVWSIPKIVYSKKTDEGIDVEGKIELSILGLEDGKPVYIEKFIDFKKMLTIDNLKDGTINFDFDITMLSINYNVNYDSIDLKLELLLTGCVYESYSKNIIVDIEVDQSKVKERSLDDSLIIYYAQPGEDIWELAKRYNTSISAILEENENIKDCTILEKTMLTIPIVAN